MAKKPTSKKSGGTTGGIAGIPSGGTKAPRVSPKGSPLRKGGNVGGTSQAGNDRVQGNSHQGSSLGKRNSG